MRIFVTGTGRYGTMTFARGCSHITNFTSGHETHRGRIGDIEYPDGHIEVDAHLVYVLPLVLERYPGAFFVHLIRGREATIASLAKRPSLDHYARFAFQATPNRRRTAAVFYAATNALIRRLLPLALVIELERAKDQWPGFWDLIGAKGDLAAALAEWDIRHKAS